MDDCILETIDDNFWERGENVPDGSINNLDVVKILVWASISHPHIACIQTNQQVSWYLLWSRHYKLKASKAVLLTTEWVFLFRRIALLILKSECVWDLPVVILAILDGNELVWFSLLGIPAPINDAARQLTFAEYVFLPFEEIPHRHTWHVVILGCGIIQGSAYY